MRGQGLNRNHNQRNHVSDKDPIEEQAVEAVRKAIREARAKVEQEIPERFNRSVGAWKVNGRNITLADGTTVVCMTASDAFVATEEHNAALALAKGNGSVADRLKAIRSELQTMIPTDAPEGVHPAKVGYDYIGDAIEAIEICENIERIFKQHEPTKESI